MNYIDDDFKWDKLISICYPGGFGGDFFCNLLQINFDPNHTFLPDQNNKFEWKKGIIKSKSINRILFFYKNLILNEKNNYENIEDSVYRDYKNFTKKYTIDFIKTIYDEDFDIFKKNYIQYIRNAHIDHYSTNKYNIINNHYDLPIENFSMHEVFPDALIYFLYAENKYNTILFYFLEIIKNFKLYNTNSFDPKIFFSIVIEKRKLINYKPFDNMIGIDAGKLFLENSDYVNEVEQIFSNTLNRKIKLDRTILNNYKKNNKNIIKKSLNIFENIHEISNEKIVKIILENYFIENKYSIQNDKFKNLLKKWESFL